MDCVLLEPAGIAPAAALSLSSSIVRTANELDGLEREWDQLFQRAGCNNVFLSFTWIAQWWRFLSQGSELSVITVRDHRGKLLAIAPMYVSRRGIFRRMSFLGNQQVGSDYLDVLLDPTCEHQCVAQLADVLVAERRKWDYVDLADTWEESKASTLLAPELERRGYRVDSAASTVCPYLELPETAEAFVRHLGSKRKKHLRYYWRSLERMGPVELVTLDSEPAIEDAFEHLLRLHRARFESRGQESAFLNEKVGDFHREVLHRLVRSGNARVHLLKVAGDPITAIYVLTAGSRACMYQSGMNPEYSRFSAGSLVLCYAMEEAIRAGQREFDFLRGDESYKFRWTDRVRNLQNVRIYDGRIKSRMARAVQRLRHLVRSLRPRPALQNPESAEQESRSL